MIALRIWLCGFVMSVLMASCHAKTLVLTTADKDKSIVIRKGDTIIVKLPVTPATGYMWHLRNEQGILVQVGSSHFEPINPGPGKPGATELQTFEFTAQRAGHEELNFTYGRQLEAVKQISFAITVR